MYLELEGKCPKEVKSWSLGELRKGQIAMKYWMGYRVDDCLCLGGAHRYRLQKVGNEKREKNIRS